MGMFAERTVSAADDSGWSDAQIRQLHAQGMRRRALGSAPDGRDSALVRRVATTNPRTAIMTVSSASFEIVRLLDSHAKVENREREAQKGRGLRGLLNADTPSLAATATGRTRLAAAASSSRPGSCSSSSSRPVSRGEARAPASPPTSRVVLNSAARLMLGDGQLSSVSIPSKLRMGASGGGSSGRVDYLATERAARTSRPPKSRAFATERGSYEQVATNFDLLPPHTYWRQEQADDWAAQAEAAREAGRIVRTPSAGRRPDWLRLADSKPAAALAAEISAALLERDNTLFLPAMRALELGLEVPLDAYPVVGASTLRLITSARAERHAPPPGEQSPAEAAAAAARRPATAPEAKGAEAMGAELARASSPQGSRASLAAQAPNTGTPVAAIRSAPRRASLSLHFFEQRSPQRAGGAELAAAKLPARDETSLDGSVRGIGVARDGAQVVCSAGVRGGSRFYHWLAAEHESGGQQARGLSRSLSVAASSRDKAAGKPVADALAAPAYGKRTGGSFFMCTASPAAGTQHAGVALRPPPQPARAERPQSSGQHATGAAREHDARDGRQHGSGGLHVASARRAVLNLRVKSSRSP